MKTKTWQEYEQGVDFKTRIGLYTTVDINERFYAGDQWVGIPHEGLPTPVINFIRYASGWKIAAVTDRRLKMQFFAEGESDGGEIGIYARQISGYSDMLWERLKMDYLTKEGLKQAAITGDYIQYFYWDPGIKTGQALSGDINTSLIDNVNYYPGNPNSPDIQSQPYIILAFRELVSSVRDEAKKNGCENWEEITADDNTEYTSGDRGKVELDNSGKCNVLLKMYKKDGKVCFEKSVRNAVVQEEKDSGLTLYPLAMMNWETRKNSCHGTAEVTGLIPNQVFINKILALAQLGQVQSSFPKIIYDRTRIREWTNKVAGAIPVNGDIGGAAQYLAPPSTSYDAWKGLETTLQTTMKMMGANEVTLGNIQNPDNTSAFIATRDAAMVPLQSQQERFYSFIEDVGHVWIDFIRNFYRQGRMIPIVHAGQRVFVPIPEGALDKFTLNLKVEVGPSSMWSEVQVLQTLDNLLKGGKISFRQYLERIPEGQIPLKDQLLAEAQKLEGSAQEMQQGGQPVDQVQGGKAPLNPQGNGQPAAKANAATQQAKAQPMGQPQGQPDGKDIGGEIVKAVQVLAQAGKLPSDTAETITKLGEQGADSQAIVQALQRAAQQGRIPAEAVQVILQAVQGGIPQRGEESPKQPEQQQKNAQSGGQDASERIVKLVLTLAQAGRIPKDVAEAVMKLSQEGASPEELLQALENAAKQGKISGDAIQALIQGTKGEEQQQQGQQPGAQQPQQGQTGPPVQTGIPQTAQQLQQQDSAQQLMAPEGQQNGIQTNGQNAVQRITGIIQTLVRAGKINSEVAEEIASMAEQGAGAEELLKALQIAAQQGKIPADIVEAIINRVSSTDRQM